MLGNNATQGVQQQRQPDLFGQIGGILGAGTEAIGGIARGAGEFIEQNPELVGVLAGAALGSPLGFGGIGAAGGLLKGSQKRQKQLATQFQRQQQQLQQQRQESVFKSQNLDKFQQQVIGDKGVESARTASAAAQNVNAILDTKNPIAAGAVKTLFPRLLGEVGNLSQSEQQAFGGSKALTARIEQAFEQWQTGKLTGENENFLREIADTLITSNVDRGNKRIGNLVRSQQAVGINTRQNLEKVVNPIRFNIPEDVAQRNQRRQEVKERRSEEEKRVTSFGSIEEAEAANLPKGTLITIGGRQARVR